MYNLNLLLVPESWLYTIAFIFGIIIGSFLNVFIYRLHTGKSLNGSSHCMSCGTALKWFELFPLFSYLALKGRCRTCGCKITSRYFAVELITGILFASALTVTTDIVWLLFLWAILAILVVITVYDLYHLIIPDILTLSLIIIAGLILLYEFFIKGISYEALLWDVGASMIGVLFFFFLWFISKGTWIGFGDVKLAFPLGIFAGANLVFSFVVLSFWIGAGVSLVLLGLTKYSRGKAGLQLRKLNITMKSAVPFAPFLVASCVVIIFTKFNVLELFSFL